MATARTTTIRLSPEGRVIQEALQRKLAQRLGPITLTQVIEYALRQTAAAEGIEVQAPAQPKAKPRAPARKK